MENGDEEDCTEMAAVATNSSSSAADDHHSLDSDSFSTSDVDDGEYGEQTLAPQTVTKNSSVAKNEFYRASMQRQNRCFGASMVAIAGSFLAAYFLMGLTFTPSNIGIFGDESSMKGSSGEVGLDADNAETQEIVDEEIIAEEEAGHWGDMGMTKAAKRSKAKREKMHFAERFDIPHNNVGKNKWVENKDWWKKNAQNLDRSHMTKKQMKEYEKLSKQLKRRKKNKKKRCKNDPQDPICQRGAPDPDLDAIRDKLAEHYNYDATGQGKENFPEPVEGPDREGGKKHDKKNKHEHNHKKNDADDNVDEEKEHSEVAEEVLPGGADDLVDEEKEEEGNEEVEEEEELEEPEEEDELQEEAEPEEEQIQSISSTFRVLGQFKHDSSSFTQGLSYGADGTIFETSGLYRQSKVRRINPETFDVELSVDIDAKYFGEGSTIYTDADGNERLIEITWREQTGFIYDAKTLDLLKEFQYTTNRRYRNEGWGITYDPSNHEFVVSDGSNLLHFWDRDTLAKKRKVHVTRLDGSEAHQLNELEYMDGLVCCNIWHSDDIICVDPLTGKSVREYDMSSLWPVNERGNRENVLNGIALGKDHVLLTGKRWDRMYKVVFPDWTTLF